MLRTAIGLSSSLTSSPPLCLRCRKVFGVSPPGVPISHTFVKRVRAGTVERGCHGDASRPMLFRKLFAGADQCPPYSFRARRLVDDEQRDLRDRRAVIERVAKMD